MTFRAIHEWLIIIVVISMKRSGEQLNEHGTFIPNFFLYSDIQFSVRVVWVLYLYHYVNYGRLFSKLHEKLDRNSWSRPHEKG